MTERRPTHDEATSKQKPSFATVQARDSATDLLQEMFQDFHRNRKQIYILNFFRGIFFGIGSAIGGTLILGLLVWLLSLFRNTWLQPLVQAIQAATNNR